MGHGWDCAKWDSGIVQNGGTVGLWTVGLCKGQWNCAKWRSVMHFRALCI